MILILEGPNRTGKTTFIDFLCSVHEFVTIKPFDVDFLVSLEANGYPPVAVKAFVYGSLLTSVKTFKNLSMPNVVFDRFHISEAVHSYSRGYVALPETFAIDEMLSEIGAKLLLMEDTPFKLEERSGKDKAGLMNIFNALYNQSKMDKMRYNLSDPATDVIKWIFDKVAV